MSAPLSSWNASSARAASDEVRFEVLGAPLGWERATPRVVALPNGGLVQRPFKPKRTRDAQAHIKLAASLAMRGREPLNVALEMLLTAVFPIPQSVSKKRRAMMLALETLPTVKPDLDNVEKLALDAMTAVVFRDDVLICRVSKAKVYGDRPRLIITIRPYRPRLSGGQQT